MIKSNKGFTLVELIVVITILAILSTIWFIAYNSYLTWARDSNRVWQLAAINDWLEIYRTNNDIPLPENSVEVRANWTVIWYQWYMWKNNLETISYSKWWIDPKDDTYFTYYVTSDLKYFQLLAYLEDSVNKQVVKNELLNKTNAISYTSRTPTVYGKKLWILTESWTNAPIQEVSIIKTAWNLDIATTTWTYVANYTDIVSISWTWSSLVASVYNASCNRIKETWWAKWDGLYTINPSWTNPIKVYCDMTTDWWWWTLVWRSVAWWTGNFWWTVSAWSPSDDTAIYSLWSESNNISFSNILLARYETWKTISLAVKVWVAKTISAASSYEPTSNQTVITTAWIPWWESWWNHRQMTYNRWETTRTDWFHFRDMWPLVWYWLLPGSYAMAWYNSTYWSFDTKQWMIFVR
jgi:prepilin-type N-terminal cleavage/methylation domain-containing protein